MLVGSCVNLPWSGNLKDVPHTCKMNAAMLFVVALCDAA